VGAPRAAALRSSSLGKKKRRKKKKGNWALQPQPKKIVPRFVDVD
jgi:hypothetical protein